jgi:hypothetical protein
MGDYLARARRLLLVPSKRSYDDHNDWIHNALEQHAAEPFHAVITMENGDDLPRVLAIDDIMPDNPLWKVAREVQVLRKAENLSQALAPLLRISKRIYFVDKFFNFEQARWREPLIGFIAQALKDRADIPEFQYHTLIDNDEFDLSPEDRLHEYSSDCNKRLAPHLPKVVDIKICKWDDKPGGPGMHARYILTDRGGVRVDWGLDAAKDRKMWAKTPITLLDHDTWENLFKSFQEPSDDFELIYSVTVTGQA